MAECGRSETSHERKRKSPTVSNGRRSAEQSTVVSEQTHRALVVVSRRTVSSWQEPSDEQPSASIAPEGGLIGTAADALGFLRALVTGALFERQDTFGRMLTRWNRFGLPGTRTAMRRHGP